MNSDRTGHPNSTPSKQFTWRASTAKDADRFEIDPAKLADAWRSPLNW